MTRKVMLNKCATYASPVCLLLVGMCLSVIMPVSVTAQVSPPAVQGDSLAVTVRQPPASVLSAYRNNPAYQYRQRTDQALTFWQKIRHAFWDWLNRLLDARGQGTVWEYVLYAIAVGLVIFAILRMLKMDLQSFFSPGAPAASRGGGGVDELDHNTDFIALAEAARKEGHLRLAARMYYVHVLKVMDAGGVINWSPRKTNQDYLAECRQHEVQPPFRRLTYLFDYAWYGDFPVDQALVAEMQTLAQDVSRRVA